MNLFSQSKPKAEPEKVQPLKSLIYELLEIDSSDISALIQPIKDFFPLVQASNSVPMAKHALFICYLNADSNRNLPL